MCFMLNRLFYIKQTMDHKRGWMEWAYNAKSKIEVMEIEALESKWLYQFGIKHLKIQEAMKLNFRIFIET